MADRVSASATRAAEIALKPYLRATLGFSVVVNLLFLVTPLYMLQIYDRVLTSGSVETLIYLTLIAVFLLLVFIAGEGGRRRVLARAGQRLGETLDGPVLRRSLAAAGRAGTGANEAAAQLSRVQALFTNATLAPLFDLPFTPLFVLILFVVHPVLGVIGLSGALVLVGLAVLTDMTSRRSTEEAAAKDRAAQDHLAYLTRQSAAIVSMGMTERSVERWQGLRRDGVEAGLRAGGPSTFLSATARSFRLILQIAVLGAAAALAIGGEVTAGSIIAASIILGRGLAPIDQTVAVWRQLVLGRNAWRALRLFLDAEGGEPARSAAEDMTPMPRPAPALSLDRCAVTVPGMNRPLLPKITVDLPQGGIIALLGSSGAGKTALLQTLAGAWAPGEGAVRLDGRDMAGWDPRDRGRFVGYLPQHVELLTGTVFENVARFGPASEDEVFAAATEVGCHQTILTLAKGYDTPIGEGGVHLSAGQRQAIGLARAYFGDPALLLLDEPTAHLDAQLSARLMARFAEEAREQAARRRRTSVIATHDLRLINAADRILLIRDRKVMLMPREDYLKRVSDLKRARAFDEAGLAVSASGAGERA